MSNSIISDHELQQAIAQHVRGLTIDPAQVRAHVIRPAHLEGVFSDRGAIGSFRFPIIHPPVPPVAYGLDVTVLTAALNDALQDIVAGYSFEIRDQGATVGIMNWQSAKNAKDGSEAWTPNVQFHVASVSKLITAMAMTRLLSDKGISPDAQIIEYLPDYWAKGPNIQYIVFRNLFNHTSGLVSPDVSDFGVMKQAIAAGISLDSNAASHLGHYSYQAINYTLCRILLAVLNGNISASAYPSLPFGFSDSFWDSVTIDAYQAYVQQNVFSPANVSGATFGHPSADGLAYRGPMGRVDDWRGKHALRGVAVGRHRRCLIPRRMSRFQSPLVEPDVQISRIRLSRMSLRPSRSSRLHDCQEACRGRASGTDTRPGTDDTRCLAYLGVGAAIAAGGVRCTGGSPGMPG
jgi:CubicO group peptidase (beta-lactamase class C family)